MCTRARESGSCENRRIIYLDLIEAAVIEGLRQQLTHPQTLAEAAKAYHAEMRRLQGERALTRMQDERKLGELRRSLDRMIDAVASGELPASAVGRRIAEAEAEANAIEARLAASPAPEVVTLHPKAIDHYLGALDELATSLSARANDAAMKILRELVHSITVYPREDQGPIRFEVKGRLAALLNGEGLGPVVPRGGITLTQTAAPGPIFSFRWAA